MYGLKQSVISQATTSGANKAYHDFNDPHKDTDDLIDDLDLAQLNERLAYSRYSQSVSPKRLRQSYVVWKESESYFKTFQQLYNNL
jgi:hypothetical protein